VDGVFLAESSAFQRLIHAAPFPLGLDVSLSHCHNKVENRIVVRVVPWRQLVRTVYGTDGAIHRLVAGGRSGVSMIDRGRDRFVVNTIQRSMSLRVVARSGRLFRRPQTTLYTRLFTNVVRGVHSSPPLQGVVHHSDCIACILNHYCSFRVAVSRTNLARPDTH
jgi:hypothetical protein